jgi:hypothetical protein
MDSSAVRRETDGGAVIVDPGVIESKPAGSLGGESDAKTALMHGF